VSAPYRHTQRVGAAWWLFMGVVVVLALVVELWFDGVAITLVVAVPILLIVWFGYLTVGRLTITVDDNTVRVFYGWGWPSTRLRVGDIGSVRAVRNSLWTRFGPWWNGRSWVWSVGGPAAVEIELTSGRSMRIGTDSPDELIDEVQRRAVGF